jgi:DNA-binding protein HU-beta
MVCQVGINFNQRGNKKTMNKSDLIKAIATREDTTEASVRGIIESFETEVLDALVRDEPVVLTLFKLETAVRAARVGVNPQTREKLNIPARKVAKFKASKRLKDALKETTTTS